MSGGIYMPIRSQPLGNYLDEGREMMIDDSDNSGDLSLTDHQNHDHHQQHMIFAEISGAERQQLRQQHQHQYEERMIRRKRAETWGQEETESLIRFRLELNGLFNTSKTNKYLWEQISCRMRGKGFYRSPSMCTEKWRNLLKDFKKAKRCEREARDRGSGGRSSAKMSYYAELEEFYKGGRKKNVRQNIGGTNLYVQFYDKGIDHSSIPFGPYEDSGRSVVNPQRGLEQNSPPLGNCEAEGVAGNGVPTWNWRETPGSGGENESAYNGRVISVKWGESTKRIGIDGSSKAINEAISSAFGLRTERKFWLEDDNGVIQTLDRDMPLQNYNLHLDKGLTIKICLYNEPNNMPNCAEERTFYSEDDFRSFLNRRGWIGLKDISCFKIVNTIEELHSGETFHAKSMRALPEKEKKEPYAQCLILAVLDLEGYKVCYKGWTRIKVMGDAKKCYQHDYEDHQTVCAGRGDNAREQGTTKSLELRLFEHVRINDNVLTHLLTREALQNDSSGGLPM